MAGTKLDFKGGYLGIERCRDPKSGKQYLRAVIHHAGTGRTTSSDVEVSEVFRFATEMVQQALLADGHPADEVTRVSWRSPVPDFIHQ